MEYRIAKSEKDFDLAKELFLEYFLLYKDHLGEQDFRQELFDIQKKYSTPEGCLILATNNNISPIGCVGIKKFDNECCEMGRLYVKEEFRNLCVGYRLIEIFLQQARKLGYKKAFLDTVPEFQSAIKLYQDFGFKEISPYYNSPIKNPIYMELAV